MKKKALAVAVAVGVLLGIGGFAVGATTTPKTGRACVTSQGVLKLVQEGSCPSRTRPITLVGKAYQGLARAYAHIKPDGTLDTARSWRVDSSDVVTTFDGFWCFRGLGFTPRNVEVSLDYNGIGNGQIAQATVVLPADPADCQLSSANAEVFTGLVDPGNFTAGTKLGFYVVFY